jgi:hypothetical protein
MKDGPLTNRYRVIKIEKHGDIVELAGAALENLSIDDIMTNLDYSKLQSCVDGCISDDKRYFVLAVDSDPGARPALRAYVDMIRHTHPELAADMTEQYDLDSPDVFWCPQCEYGQAIIDTNLSARHPDPKWVYLACQDCMETYPLRRRDLVPYGRGRSPQERD